jgi:hypothetical protein
VRCLSFICAILLLSDLCIAQATQPATAPAAELPDPPIPQPAARVRINPEEARRRQAEMKQKILADAPDAGAYDLGEIISFSLRQHTVHARFHPPERLVRIAKERSPVRLTIKGDAGVWEFSQVEDRNTDATGPYTALTRYDFDAIADPTRFDQAAVHIRNDRVTLRGARGGPRPTTVLLNIQRNPDPVMNLTVTGQRARAQNVRSVYQLRREQSQAVREQLKPLLAVFEADHLLAPGATDFYRAFESIPADPQVRQEVEDLVPRLETEPFELREDAMDELNALGPAGVLAILRMDRSRLGPEAQRRLQVHLARHTHWPEEPPADALKNTDFLLEALAFPDPAVREAAAGQLQRLTGHAIDGALLENPTPEAIERLRQTLPPGGE